MIRCKRKNSIYLLLIIILIGSCTRSPTSHNPTSTNTVALKYYTPDFDKFSNDVLYVSKMEMDKRSYAPAKILSRILQGYSNKIIVDNFEIRNKTALIKINNSEYLTEQMGTSGAINFLISVTYNLTEFSNISAVNFLFTEGSHAVPGIYTRQNELFKYHKIIYRK